MSSKALMERIRKLLALSRSPNPHEAAEALRRAQDLMAEHAITEDDLALSGIGEFTSSAAYPRADNPADYVWRLANMVGRAFGARSIWDPNTYRFRFYGRIERAEPAAYACAVLWRQLHVARQAYLRAQRRNLKRTTRIARADRYAEGWICSASAKVRAIALPPEEVRLIGVWYDQNLGGKIHQAPARPPAKARGTDEAMWDGVRDGRAAQLHAPMGSAPAMRQIGSDAS